MQFIFSLLLGIEMKDVSEKCDLLRAFIVIGRTVYCESHYLKRQGPEKLSDKEMGKGLHFPERIFKILPNKTLVTCKH